MVRLWYVKFTEKIITDGSIVRLSAVRVHVIRCYPSDNCCSDSNPVVDVYDRCMDLDAHRCHSKGREHVQEQGRTPDLDTNHCVVRMGGNIGLLHYGVPEAAWVMFRYCSAFEFM